MAKKEASLWKKLRHQLSKSFGRGNLDSDRHKNKPSWTYVPKVAGGKIKFLPEGLESREMESEYMIVVDESVENIEDLASDMAGRWGLTTPKLVLSIISNVNYFKTWKRPQDVEEFKAGLMEAACLTDMWILTEGRYSGISALIGGAVAMERSRRNIIETEQTLVRFLSPERLSLLTVIGVLSSRYLTENQMEDIVTGTYGDSSPVVVKLTDIEGDDYVQLNPNLTHFFVLNEAMGPSACANFQYRLENRLMRPVGKERRYLREMEQENVNTEAVRTPLIGLLIQGGPEDFDHVLSLLKRKVPVIVISGQGKAADILAFAFRAAQGTVDAENYRTYINTELLRRLSETFPEDFRDNSEARNQCRDRVIQCVACATEGESALLTLVEHNLQGFEMKDLSKVILTAVLTSYDTQGLQSEVEQIQWNLQLTIDWKRPDLAVTEIYNKSNLSKFWVGEEQFQQVLISPGREEFVELFLNWGFVLHKYLNHRRLELLFELCYDKAFFAGICVETILGEKMTLQRPIPEDFVDSRECLLNRLLQILTGLGSLINPLILSLNAGHDRAESAPLAEQRALHALVYWSALTNNTKLTRILWSRTSEPMAMALVLSTLHSRLAKNWIWDHDLRLRVKNTGKEYGQLAVTLLDYNYSESIAQGLTALTSKLADFKDYTAVDLALMGENKYFIAHPCCQRYINNLWYGHIRVKRRRTGFFTLPDIVKIFLSLILIVPCYFWINLVDISHSAPTVSDQIRPTSSQTHRSWSLVVKSFLLKHCVTAQKLYYMMVAPITKFWLTQLMFASFLTVYGYSLGQPLCGNRDLSIVVCVWQASLFIEQLYISADKKWHWRENSIAPNVRLMLVLAYSGILELCFRVFYLNYLTFPMVKILLCFSLIYFFYYAMGYFFPVSQELGPMIVNISIMMRQDLVKWFKILSMTLLSGSITIHAILYPAMPLSVQSVLLAAKRGIFGLFLTDVDDLGGEACTCLYNYTFQYGCRASEISDEVRDSLEMCPYSSPGGYFIVLQYIFHIKLVFGTLIFAICSVTMTRTYQTVVEIWKYQFFMLVLSYVRRPALPAPLMIVLYPWICLKTLYSITRRFCLACSPCCPGKFDKGKSAGGYSIWKVCIKTLNRQEKLKQDNLNRDRYRENRLKTIQRDQSTLGKNIESLNDRMVEVLNNQTSIFLMMEHMNHVVHALASKKSHTLDEVIAQKTQHTNSRKSPYAGTGIRRFAVFDKNVPWEEPYPGYDPPIYTRALDEYDKDVRPFVDPDLFEVLKQREELDKFGTEQLEGKELLPEFVPQYNISVQAVNTNQESFTLDRKSWITKDDNSVLYTTDQKGAPKNPMGRTGLQGRGNLWRWGPNHMMYGIISRWRSVYNSNGIAQGPLLINGKRVMEILVIHNEQFHEETLPGGFVNGRTSRYSVMCEVFMRDLLGEKDVPGSETLDQEDMTQFFRQFVSSDFILSGIIGRSIAASSSFSSNLIFRGYMDDSSNTDNAWVEAEVWSFHYHSKDKFDKKLPQREKHWREVSASLQLSDGQLPHVLEVARMYEDVG